MPAGRAPKGGTTGINGEFYEGGKFLPSTTQAKSTPVQRKKGSGKAEIEPYKWEVPPSEGLRPVRSEFLHMLDLSGAQPQPNREVCAHYRRNPGFVMWMYQRYMQGERWHNPEESRGQWNAEHPGDPVE